MKTLRLFFTFTLLFTFINMQAQDDANSKKLVLKLYANGFYRYNESSDCNRSLPANTTYKSEKKNYDFGNLSFAVELLNDKFFTHEFEFMPIKIKHNDEVELLTYTQLNHTLTISGGKSTSVETAFRYQLNHYFNNTKKVVPYIGLSPQLFYNYYKLNPATSNQFPNTEQNIGINLAIAPSLLINISNKFSLDFNIPLDLYEIKLNAVNCENPAIALEAQKKTKIEGQLIPKTLNVRFGLVYKI